MGTASTVSKKPSGFLVLGYFHRNNLGDEIFLKVWEYLAQTRAPKNTKVLYASLEDGPEDVVEAWTQVSSSDLPSAIIIAGGDVLTEYFSIRIRNVVQELEQRFETYGIHIPVYGISVAAPFESAVHLGFCDFYTQLLARPSANVPHLKGRMGRYAVTHSQDLSCYLLQMYGGGGQHRTQTSRKLAVCLAAQICGSGLDVYIPNIKNLAAGIASAYQKCNFDEIVFIPFDTSGTESDDVHLNKDLMDEIKLIDPKIKTSTMDTEDSVEKVYAAFRSGDFEVALCGRYHSHMMAVLSHTPVASVCVTQKVSSLLQEIDDLHSMPCAYRPVLDDYGVPYSFDQDAVSKCIEYSHSNANKLKSKFKTYCDMLKNDGIAVFDRAIRNIFHNPCARKGVSRISALTSVSERAEKCLLALLSHVSQKYQVQAESRLEEFKKRAIALKDVVSPDNVSQEDQAFMASIVCVSITHDMFPPYHYGLAEKIMETTHLLDDIEYIIHNHGVAVGRKRYESCLTVPQTMIKEMKKTFECPGINRISLWGIHRAGWEYVLRHLWYAHDSDELLPIFDDYVDSTFNWMSDALAAAGTIPYRRPWFGCIHHTATKQAGPNNLENVFENPHFIKSLRKCKFLIAMSKSLVDDIRKRLEKCGMTHVQVHEFVHPSEIPNATFNWNEFIDNENKMLVQIGCWYREPYMLYTLDLPRKSWIKKAAVRGKRMHNNFPPEELKINATSEDPPMNIGVSLYSKSDDTVGPVSVQLRSSKNSFEEDVVMCRPDGVKNSFVFNMMHNIVKDFHSVSVIEHLDNDAYDRLLTRNVVFLHMIDAGAINTLIECILRNTPILINRLPAVEQVLGSSYPLFYDNATTASVLACSPEKIKKAHEHISKIDKSNYNIEFFVKRIMAMITNDEEL